MKLAVLGSAVGGASKKSFHGGPAIYSQIFASYSCINSVLDRLFQTTFHNIVGFLLVPSINNSALVVVMSRRTGSNNGYRD